MGFYTVVPCRLADTRDGSPLAAEGEGRFVAWGRCNVPEAADVILGNVTAVAPAKNGHLSLVPENCPGLTSTLNLRGGRVRANNFIVKLHGEDGSFRVCNSSAGTVHVIVDVVGYALSTSR